MIKKLEEYKFFSLFAWVIIIAFFAFVLLLILNARKETYGPHQRADLTEQVLENVSNL